nr:unnamed protein product [Callosobruchus chinensis]
MHNDKQIAATTNELTNCPQRANTYIFFGKYHTTRKKNI